jgi:hypothetical protein
VSLCAFQSAAQDKRRQPSHWLYPLCSGQNKTIPLVLGEPDLMENTEINYFVQYQKNNLSIALWDLFNTTGIETRGYLIMTNELLHISLI